MDSIDDDVVKYGISSDPIGKDGLSDRLRRQLGLFNAIVGWARFYGKILIKGIKGRKKQRMWKINTLLLIKKSINESQGLIKSRFFISIVTHSPYPKPHSK